MHQTLRTSKRGQGLSINTIILIVIALVVLVILVAITLNFTKKGSKGANDAGNTCETELVGGQCQTGTGTDGKSCATGSRIFAAQCPVEGQICCPKTT